MSESAISASLKDTPIDAIEVEEIDALPVLAEDLREAYPQAARAALPGARRSTGAMLPAAQAVAVAAGGFVAGAAVLGLVQRRQRRSSTLAKGGGAGRAIKKARHAGALDTRRAGARAAELVQIVDSRTLLVDVHLLGRPGER